MNVFQAANCSSLQLCAKISPCWWLPIHLIDYIFHLQDVRWDESSAETARALPACISWRCSFSQAVQLSTFWLSVALAWRTTQSQQHHGKKCWAERDLRRVRFAFSSSRHGKAPFWIQHITTCSKATEMLQGLLEDLKDKTKSRG